MQMIEKVEAFIEYAKEMEQKIEVAFQNHKEVYLFGKPDYIELQKQLKDRAQEVGVVSIIHRDGENSGGLLVTLKPEIFDEMGFSSDQVIERTQEMEYINLKYLDVTVGNDKYSTCVQFSYVHLNEVGE